MLTYLKLKHLRPSGSSMNLTESKALASFSLWENPSEIFICHICEQETRKLSRKLN